MTPTILCVLVPEILFSICSCLMQAYKPPRSDMGLANRSISVASAARRKSSFALDHAGVVHQQRRKSSFYTPPKIQKVFNEMDVLMETGGEPLDIRDFTSVHGPTPGQVICDARMSGVRDISSVGMVMDWSS